MAVSTGFEIFGRLMAALGIDDPRVRRVTITVAVDEVLSVQVDRLMDRTETDAVLTVLEQQTGQ